MIAADEWSPADGFSLEPNAFSSATEISRNVLVIAGPGAGKTEMLAQRADFLLRTGSCAFPRRILAISFKTDAAENLRSRVAERCGHDLARRLDSQTFHAFAKRLIDKYRVVLVGADALNHDYEVGPQRVKRRQITFDDMVPLATDILLNSQVARNAIRNTYSHVFLDEFQDCTNIQYQFLRTAFGSTPAQLTAVGDTKQRIMRYAGALEGVFEQFADESDADVRYLYQNFRSAHRIRRVHNAMVKVMEPRAALPDEDVAGDDGIVALLEYRSCSEEAADLAARIESWIDEGVAPSEIAVLVRQQAHLYARALASELDDRGIAYRNEQALQDDFAQPAGQLVLDFLAVMLHDRQADAYRRLMSVLDVSTGDDEIDQQNAARWREMLTKSRALIQADFETDDAGATMLAVTRSFINAIGSDRLTALSPEYGAGDRLQQVIDNVLGRIGELAQGVDGSLDELTQVTDDGAVRILTVHKAKGLEFDSVVVLGAEDETYWSEPEDERAVFFVAVSRAKRQLIVTTTDHRTRPDGARRWDSPRSRHGEFVSFIETVISESSA